MFEEHDVREYCRHIFLQDANYHFYKIQKRKLTRSAYKRYERL